VAADLTRAAGYYLTAARTGHEDSREMLRSLLALHPKEMAAITADWKTEEWAVIGKPAHVKAAQANVRAEPELGSQIVTQLDAGDKILDLGRNGRWVHAALPDRGITAWIHDSLVESGE